MAGFHPEVVVADSESDVFAGDAIYLCPVCFVDRTEPVPRRTVPCRLCSAAMSIEHSLAGHKICVTYARVLVMVRGAGGDSAAFIDLVLLIPAGDSRVRWVRNFFEELGGIRGYVGGRNA